MWEGVSLPIGGSSRLARDLSSRFSFDTQVGMTTAAVFFLCHLSWSIVVLI